MRDGDDRRLARHGVAAHDNHVYISIERMGWILRLRCQQRLIHDLRFGVNDLRWISLGVVYSLGQHCGNRIGHDGHRLIGVAVLQVFLPDRLRRPGADAD